MTVALLASLAAFCGASGSPSMLRPLAPPSDTLEVRLFEGGSTFADFLEATRRRRETWHANYARAEPPADLVARARAIPGRWSLLAVTVDGCGDSAHTVPYLARFVEAVEGLELRLVEPDVGRPVMDARPTPDGRGATPTVVVLDEDGRDVGCWIERPVGIQSWWIANPDGLATTEKLNRKYAWYEADAGYHTILEVVESVEAAARGERICGRPVDEAGPWPPAGPVRRGGTG